MLDLVSKYSSGITQMELLGMRILSISAVTCSFVEKTDIWDFSCRSKFCSFVNFAWGRKTLAWNVNSRRYKYFKWCNQRWFLKVQDASNVLQGLQYILRHWRLRPMRVGTVCAHQVHRTRCITNHGKGPMTSALYHVIAPSNDWAITPLTIQIMQGISSLLTPIQRARRSSEAQ